MQISEVLALRDASRRLRESLHGAAGVLTAMLYFNHRSTWFLWR